MKKTETASLYTAIFVGFIDYCGLGLIYPVFSSMLFDPSIDLLPMGTSNEVRGMWLGLLVALMPLMQFFSSPIWGALSDVHGRRKPLQYSLALALGGYLLSLMGVFFSSIYTLLLSRLAIGFAAGNISIVQAAIADFSTPENKAKNFGLYNMGLGIGFTLGPFFGGLLSEIGYSIPFFFTLCLVALNLLFACLSFKETNTTRTRKSLSCSMALWNIQKAFQLHGLKSILFCSFLHNFAWSYFFEFSPVYLISRFQFSPLHIGLFFGLSGAFYAISAGVLIRPLIDRFKSETLFFGGMFFASLILMLLPSIPTISWIWPFLFLLCYFVAMVWPSATALISNSVSPSIQGEVLGVLASVNSLAYALSPLCSGTSVGAYPAFPMLVGGSIMLISALLILGIYRFELFALPLKAEKDVSIDKK